VGFSWYGWRLLRNYSDALARKTFRFSLIPFGAVWRAAGGSLPSLIDGEPNDVTSADFSRPRRTALKAALAMIAMPTAAGLLSTCSPTKPQFKAWI
jgi:hypothetical protein